MMVKAYTSKTRQGGFVLNAEFMLYVVIMVLGLVVGWVTIRDSVNAELVDTANAIESSITMYYFNDPNRGGGASFIKESLCFVEPGPGEGQSSTPVPCPQDLSAASEPSDAFYSNGTIQGFAGGESGLRTTVAPTAPVSGPADAFGSAGSVSAFSGGESGETGAATSATGTVTAPAGSESGG